MTYILLSFHFNVWVLLTCLYKKRDNDKTIDPSFTPIDNANQLRVLTISNETFEVDLVPLYDEFMLSKNQIKRKYFQNNIAQSATVRYIYVCV